MEKQQTETEVVAVGAGYAGLLATVRLAGKLRRKRIPAKITLINASDVFVERLKLHEFAAHRTIKDRPISDVLRGTGIDFIQAEVKKVDAGQNTLIIESEAGTQRIHYDKLLYALGSTTNRDSMPGVRDYAYTLTPSGRLSAADLREKLPSLNERGGRMVICGGGATGIESAAEFAAAYPNLEVRLLTRGPFGQSFGKAITSYMRQSLERLGVTIQDHTTVTRVKADEIETDGGPVPCDLCLWTGGFVASPVARDSGLMVNERGQTLVDPFMRSISHPDIFAIGDAAFPVEEPGVHVRMAALTAVILGAHGADCLAAVLEGKTPKPLSFAYLGQGIALGPHNAVGFNNYPNDKPNPPYFTGRFGYEGRELFVRVLADLSHYERRWSGIFFWLGKGRYAASRRRLLRTPQIDSSM